MIFVSKKNHDIPLFLISTKHYSCWKVWEHHGIISDLHKVHDTDYQAITADISNQAWVSVFLLIPHTGPGIAHLQG